MLKSMRSKRNALKWTLVLVIAAFIGFIFVEWGMGRTGRELSDTTILKVNSRTYSQQNFLRLFRQLYNNYKNQYKDKFSMNLAVQMNLPETVLQQMVNQAIIENEAKELGLTVTDRELSDAIQKIPQFQRDGKFIGIEEYKSFVFQMGFTVTDFENDVRNYLLAEKVRDYVTAGAIISKDKLWLDYQKENDQAKVEFLQLNLSDLKNETKIDEEELISFYEKNKQEFKTPEKRKGDFILIKIEDLKKEVSIKDDDVFQYFQKNKNFFRIPAKTKISRIARKYSSADREEKLKELEEIREKLTPQNFADYARKLSEDEKANNGGDWGYYEWQNLSSVEQQVIEKAKQSDISYVIDNGSELVIILISEKSPETQRNYEEVKEQIKNFLLADRARKAASEKIEKIYQKYKESKDLKAELKESKIKVQETEFLLNGETIEGADNSGIISQQLFNLKENEISAPLEMMEGFAIVQLKKILHPEVIPFEKAREEVRKKLEKEKKLEELTKRALKIIDEIKNYKPEEIEKYLKKEDLSFKEIEYKRGNKLASFEEYPELDKIIFSLNQGEFAPILKYPENVVILRLKEKTEKSRADFENDFPSYYYKKHLDLKDELFNIYLQNKSKNYKIRLNEKLFLELKESFLKRGDI